MKIVKWFRYVQSYRDYLKSEKGWFDFVDTVQALLIMMGVMAAVAVCLYLARLMLGF